jgi:hypothetical protein
VKRSALRAILLALLAALLAGLVVGTLIRLHFERPVRYLGAAPTGPFDVGASGAAVLDPGEHEEQVG